MNQPPTTDLTQKPERTRQHILDTALDLFVAQGYERTTMREIAAKADCSLGLAYRYFARKEELVLVLYQRLAAELAAHVETLPPGRLAERFQQVMQAHLERLAPYQEALAALFGAALNPQSDVGVLSEGTAQVRQQVATALGKVVSGASDAPGARQAAPLTTVLFGAHLGLVLFWLQDPSREHRLTIDLLALTGELLGLLRPLLRLPPAARTLERVARLIEPVLLFDAVSPPAKRKEP